MSGEEMAYWNALYRRIKRLDAYYTEADALTCEYIETGDPGVYTKSQRAWNRYRRAVARPLPGTRTNRRTVH